MGEAETEGAPAPRVTALRHRGGMSASVEVWLDGQPWRRLREDVVVRAGLLVGVRLDRERAVTVARERRRAAAMAVAVRALDVRDHSSASLRRRLSERGVSAAVGNETVERLEQAGALDDRRAATVRAAALADRGWGDAGIRADLDARGFVDDVAATALAALEPERDRAERLLDRHGRTPETLRRLARRGFADDLVEDLIASLGNGAIG